MEVIVGVLGRAHGIRGDMSVDVRSDEPARRFAKGARVRIAGEPHQYAVASTKTVAGRFIVHLDGVEDRSAAERLTGQVLVADVDANESPSGADEFYDRQLIGLRVLGDDDAAALGRVREVLHGPAQDVLVVGDDGSKDPAGSQSMVPFVAILVPDVNVDEGWLRLSPQGVAALQAGWQ